MSTVPSDPKPQRSNRQALVLYIGLIVLLLFCCFVAFLFNSAVTDVEPTVVVEVGAATEDVSATEALEEVVDVPAATDEATDEPPPTQEPASTDEPAPTDATAPTAPPSPTTPPEPTAALPPTVAPELTETSPALPTLEELRELTAAELVLRDTLDEALGESNRGLGRKLNLFSPGLPGLMEGSIIIGWAADAASSNADIRAGMAEDTLTVLRVVNESGLDYDAILIGVKYPMFIEQLGITDELEVLTLDYSRDTLAAIDWNTITASEVFETADLFIIHPDFEE